MCHFTFQLLQQSNVREEKMSQAFVIIIIIIVIIIIFCFVLFIDSYTFLHLLHFEQEFSHTDASRSNRRK